MAKMTLLEIVQDILNDLESDSVNSINDTVEAQEIAQIVKTTYANITDGRDWPHLSELFQLESLGDTNKPNYMKIPDTIQNTEWIKYNIRKSTDTKDKFVTIPYKTPVEFLVLVEKRDSSKTNIQVVSDFSGVSLNIQNDKVPQWFTSFDDQYVVFDSWDHVANATCIASKSSGRGRRNIIFSLVDSYIPDLPVQMFSYLLNEAKATAFITVKQSVNSKAEQHSVTQRRRMSQNASKIKNGVTYPNYGRK